MDPWRRSSRRAQPRSASSTSESRPAPGAASGAPAISEEALAEAAAAAGIDLADLSADERAQLEAMMLEMAEVQAQLASAPAAQVILNHMRGFYDLAGIHLSQDPPHFDEASLAIDAMAGVLDAIEPRLGDDGPMMRQALSQLQTAFIELRRRAAGEV